MQVRPPGCPAQSPTCSARGSARCPRWPSPPGCRRTAGLDRAGCQATARCTAGSDPSLHSRMVAGFRDGYMTETVRQVSKRGFPQLPARPLPQRAEAPTRGVDVRVEHAPQRAQHDPHAISRCHRRPPGANDVLQKALCGKPDGGCDRLLMQQPAGRRMVPCSVGQGSSRLPKGRKPKPGRHQLIGFIVRGSLSACSRGAAPCQQPRANPYETLQLPTCT